MEDELIGKARRGNKEALAQLLYNQYEMLYRYLLKFTLNAGIAEDITQETMVRAIEKFDWYDPEKAKFSTWLISIAQHLYVDSLRKRKHEDRYIKVDPEEWLQEEAPQQDEEWEQVLQILAGLTEGVKLPIVLKHYYGYEYEEIASIMHMPVGTVKSRVHYGLACIRKELRQDGA